MWYSITYCCGHEGSVELCGKSSERERKLEWHKNNLCPQCYAAKRREEEIKTGLQLVVDINPYMQRVVLHFDGDTTSYKSEIKELGYRWGELEAQGAFGLLQIKSQRAWQLWVTPENMDDQISKAKALGAKIINNVTAADLSAWSEVAAANAEKKAKKDARLAEWEKPIPPTVVKDVAWNQKVYGRPGAYCIYINNIRKSVTDEQAQELINYAVAREKYDTAIKAIEAEFKPLGVQ